MAAEQQPQQITMRFSTMGALDVVQGAGKRQEQAAMFGRWQRSVPGSSQENVYAAINAGGTLLRRLDAMPPTGLIAIVPENEDDSLQKMYSEKMNDTVAFSKRIRDTRVAREAKDTTRVYAAVPPPLEKGPQLVLPVTADVYKRSFITDVDPAARMHVERGLDASGNSIEPIIVVTKATLDGFLGNEQQPISYV